MLIGREESSRWKMNKRGRNRGKKEVNNRWDRGRKGKGKKEEKGKERKKKRKENRKE